MSTAAMGLPSPEHTIWLESHGVAFVYLPKVACTSWKLFLARSIDPDSRGGETLSYAEVHRPDVLPLPYLSGMPASSQERFRAGVKAGSIRLLAVVREPRQRILSAYLDKIRDHANPESFFSREVMPAIRRHHRLGPEQRPDLEQFLQWLRDAPPSATTRNDHWRPMGDLLGLDDEAIAAGMPGWTLWTMEAMDTAVEHVRQLLGCSLPFPSRQALGPRPTTGSAERVATMVPPSLEPLFAQLYGTDLRLFAAVERTARAGQA
jgi:hypothetical protein